MDVKMEDVTKSPEATDAPAPVEAPSVSTLDGWVEQLYKCQQLKEDDVHKLCEKVWCLTPAYRRLSQPGLLTSWAGQGNTARRIQCAAGGA